MKQIIFNIIYIDYWVESWIFKIGNGLWKKNPTLEMVKGVAHMPFFKVNEGRGRCVFVFGVNEKRTVLEILKFTTTHQPMYIPL